MSKRWLGLLLLTVWFGASGVARAAFSVSPDPLDIGPVVLGTSRTADDMVTSDITFVVTVTLGTGGDCNQFLITSPTTFTVSTTPTTVTVRLTPGSIGLKTCTVTITKQSNGSFVGMFVVQGTGALPQITVAPAPPGPIDFARVDVLTTGATQLVTATNTGTVPLTITSATVPAPHTSDYAVSGIAGMQTVAMGASVHWDIACKPQIRGPVDSTFVIASNAASSPSSITLKCTGDQGILSVDTSTFDFGATLLNSTKTTTVLLSNTGNVAVTGIIGVLDKPTVGYSIDPLTPVPATLAPGDTSFLTIRFAPTKVTDGGAANITFSGTWHGHTTTATTALAGQTVSLILSTNTVAFGDFRFDEPQQQTFHIINGGSAGIPIQSISLNTDLGTAPTELPFTIKLGAAIVTPPSTIPAGQQFDVTVTATPTNRTGLVGGTFVVHSSLVGLVDQSVVVTGNAIAAGISATAMVDFGAVDMDVAVTTPPKMAATITNTGTANLDVSAVTITAMTGTSGAFTFTNPLPTTPTSLAPTASLSFEATYKPTVERGPTDIPDKVVLGATLTGVLNGPVMQTITIQGHGVDRHLAIDAPTFPPTFRNPGDAAPVQAVTVQNTGDAVLQITAVMVSGDPVWQLVGASPVDIPGKSSHDFMVKFSPSDFGPAPTGQLTLMSNDNLNMTRVVTLTGTGVPRDVSFGADSGPAQDIDLGFGGVQGQITADDVLTVTNHDPKVAFTIHAIQLSGDPGFSVDPAPGDIALPASTAKRFTVSFVPTAVGDFHATATLLLDQDPVSTADVQITAHAVLVDVHGGGCTAGRELGGGAVILIVVAGLAGARRRRAAVIIGVLAVLPARAFADDVRVGAFDPTPATTGTGFQLQSPDTGADGSWAVTAILSYASNLLVADSVSPTGAIVNRDAVIQRSSLLQLGAAYAFLDRFEAGAHLPVFSQSGQPAGDQRMGFTSAPANGTALGDLTLHAKARLVDMARLTAAAAVHITLPTSTSGQFTGVDWPTLRVLGLATVTPLPRLTLSFNGGAVLRKTADYRNQIFIEQGSGLAWGAGASVRVVDHLFAVGEVFGELVPKATAMTGSVSPIEGLVGASYRAERWFAVGFAIGRGLSSGVGAPELRGTFTLTFTSGGGRIAPAEPEPPRVRVADGATAAAKAAALDSDHDGIPDERDQCPLEPEDRDGFQDEDGCPDPDNDGDGIPDAQDKCPDQPETFNGIEDEDGCPDVGDTSAAVGVTPGQSPAKAAEQTFQRGRELMAQRKYKAACAAFEQSQHLDPAAGTRFNLAGCYAEIGKLATAWTLYRELARSDKNAERRVKSGQLAAQLTPRVPKIKMVLHGAPPDVNVFMNASNANALIGIETPVDFGMYTIVAGAPNHRGWRKTVEVKQEAEVITIEIDLGPELAP